MRYPLVKQQSIKDCGPCSLASIIIYYKGYLSVETLSIMMKTTKDGTTAYDLIETAKKIGFDAKGIKVDSVFNLQLPCICHVTISNIYQHYIVLYKVDNKKKRVLIGDPATGIKYLSFKDFYHIWNNIVILLTPQKKLPKISYQPFIKYLVNTLTLNKKSFILLLLATNIYLIISFLCTLFIKNLIDNISNISFMIFIIFIIIYFCKILIAFLKNKIAIKVSKTINLSLTNNIIESLILLPYPYYRNHTTGEIISRYNDTESIKEIITEVIALITNFPLFIIMLIYLFYLNIKIGILTTLILLLYIFIYTYMSKKILNTFISYREEKSFFHSTLVESINGFESIKGINIKNIIINKLKDSNQKVEDNIYKYQSLYNIRNTFLEIISIIGSFIILYIGLLLKMSIGSVILIYVIYNYMIDPLSIIIDFVLKYKEASYIARKISEFKIREEEGNIKPTNYDITFKHLNYKIGLNYILKDINLYIKQGSKVFITGSSGSGKSTLVRLIKGYYKTKNLYIGDTKINKCSQDKILYIGQNEHIFRDTLYNNLFTDNKEVDDIVKTCLVNKDLSLFLEEDGFNLSGGEKERVILARALARDFEILIIDEALEEVDINKERIILKKLFNIYKDKTIIVISHRLDNLDLYSNFIKLEDGSATMTSRLN